MNDKSHVSGECLFYWRAEGFDCAEAFFVPRCLADALDVFLPEEAAAAECADPVCAVAD